MTWPEDRKKPKTEQLHSLVGVGALGGAFWGLLFGLIFLVPLLGAAVGAATGAFAGALTDVGIDDGFIKEVRETVTPGTSALFLMTSDAVHRQGARRVPRHPRRAHPHQPLRRGRGAPARGVRRGGLAA